MAALITNDDDNGSAEDEAETRARIAAVREARDGCALELYPRYHEMIENGAVRGCVIVRMTVE